ncbi:MAG: GTPase, partial [Bacteroidaceae bacterium]
MNTIQSSETITAIATAQGGAIGVVRLSGPASISITDQFFKPLSGPTLAQRDGYSLVYGQTYQEDGTLLDDVLVSLFRAPNSYTGEESIEISCHGSSFILQQTLARLIALGARMALPGEFTQRAFLNGKMDLSQAEAVADLIASTSEATHRLAMQQMRGGYSDELKSLRDRLLHLCSLLELELDFGDHEELEFANRDELIALTQQLQKVLSKLVSYFKLGNAIKNGIPVAIIGPTNSGKSTLLNRLLHEEKA